MMNVLYKTRELICAHFGGFPAPDTGDTVVSA